MLVSIQGTACLSDRDSYDRSRRDVDRGRTWIDVQRVLHYAVISQSGKWMQDIVGRGDQECSCQNWRPVGCMHFTDKSSNPLTDTTVLFGVAKEAWMPRVWLMCCSALCGGVAPGGAVTDSVDYKERAEPLLSRVTLCLCEML